jgi:hypothetical protein
MGVAEPVPRANPPNFILFFIFFLYGLVGWFNQPKHAKVIAQPPLFLFFSFKALKKKI